MFLLAGGDSEIGAATFRYLKASGKAATATTRRPQLVSGDRPLLDLAADVASWAPPPAASAACILAARARLADCAADPAGAARINVHQTLALVERLTAQNVYVLFLSTNQVFDGSVPHMRADAPASPVSEYGRQKARTEAALRERMLWGAPIGILRLAKVVSPAMPLLCGWARALQAGEPIRAFHDMQMAPAPMEHVSAAIAVLLESRTPGIFQLTGPQDVSYADIAHRLARRLGADPALVVSLGAMEAGLPEGSTPRHTTLDSDAMRERFGIAVPEPWQVMDRIVESDE
jgi:dTDP-4-dehydrorhamnose reductase